MNGFMYLMMFIMADGCLAVGSGQEPQSHTCVSKFDYDFKLMEKLANLEEKQIRQDTLINELQEKLRVSQLPRWGDWSSWSGCFFNCTGSNGGRLQTRSRETVEHSPTLGPQTETEERPCNAVQFAGCIKDFGADDNYGVTYDFGDQIAVSTCTSIFATGSNHVYAVRRKCSNLSVSCDETCKNVGLTCFNALHVYKSPPVLKRNQDGAKGLYVYRYNGCDGNFCGPNFCCCHA